MEKNDLKNLMHAVVQLDKQLSDWQDQQKIELEKFRAEQEHRIPAFRQLKRAQYEQSFSEKMKQKQEETSLALKQIALRSDRELSLLENSYQASKEVIRQQAAHKIKEEIFG